MSTCSSTIPQMRKMLKNMQGWLTEAESYAEDRGFHPDRYLSARLHLDQFELTRQVQAACDNLKGAAARLSGQEAPRHEDDESTFDELKARIEKVLAHTDHFTEADFAGVEERVIALPFLPPTKGATAETYVIEFALPNFYFHVTMVYAILRHCGVKLGKRAYIGGMELVDVEA